MTTYLRFTYPKDQPRIHGFRTSGSSRLPWLGYGSQIADWHRTEHEGMTEWYVSVPGIFVPESRRSTYVLSSGAYDFVLDNAKRSGITAEKISFFDYRRGVLEAIKPEFKVPEPASLLHRILATVASRQIRRD